MKEVGTGGGGDTIHSPIILKKRSEWYKNFLEKFLENLNFKPFPGNWRISKINSRRKKNSKNENLKTLKYGLHLFEKENEMRNFPFRQSQPELNAV